ncbi:hypothetical protein SAV14893_081670 [Streptomyces avermitilis]|uniref:Uncharacterized protein n=1 Tax=Streptomyces avermitilis TaxID=33903 RepID=A0A4D4MAD8_STRAX|nr:hypothetical protein SAV14893_081670 [Streptomyces avermitilis]GDY70843.1 hypothetical protein SAV31267_003280 [Streptomyces avermitilis]
MRVALRVECVEGGEDVGRFGAGGVVGVGEGPADGAGAVDDVGGGQREGARVAVVDALEVEAELVGLAGVGEFLAGPLAARLRR